jgi:hypothetical protein
MCSVTVSKARMSKVSTGHVVHGDLSNNASTFMTKKIIFYGKEGSG